MTSMKNKSLKGIPNSLGFMTTDGRGGPCLLSPEESEAIERFEGLSLSKPQPMSTETRKETEKKIFSTIPEEDRDEVWEILRKNHEELDRTTLSSEQSNTKNKTTASGSYIRIVCYEDADPKNNRLKLRNNPPTIIELQPGENKLTVNDYPDLKKGFTQDDSINRQCRCEDVIEVDFSHFDGSCIETMEGMFENMQVEKITFGQMSTPNLKNTARAFSNFGIPIEEYYIEELDISGLDFSNVENMMAMFQNAYIRTLKMENANLNNLKNGRNAIRHCMIEKLILDGLKIQDPNLFQIHLGPSTISLKRCDPATICAIIESYETIVAKNFDYGGKKWIPTTYILDSTLEYSLTRDSEGQVKCTLSHKNSRCDAPSDKNIEAYTEHIDDNLTPYFKSGITKILPKQFFGNTEIINIDLPEGITSIGESAFANCSALRRISLPSSLEEIEEGAFLDCTSLESVKLPANVKKLGYDFGSAMDRSGEIFKDCTNLKEIILPENLETIGESIFEGCKGLQSIQIPQGVKYIGRYAFAGCSSLEMIDIPKSVREIKYGAFKDCVALKKIIFHDSLIIGIRAFEGCTSLSDIDFSNARESSISERAFAGCTGLKTASLYGCFTHGGGRGIFQNCSPDVEISWDRMKKDNGLILEGENWRKINSYLDCESLIIPQTVFTLGQSLAESNGSWNNYYNRLVDCRSLKKVFVPKHVIEIGVGAFEKCNQLKYLIIQSPETRICGMAFENCNALETILVPKGFKDVFIKMLQHGNLSSLESLVKENPD